MPALALPHDPDVLAYCQAAAVDDDAHLRTLVERAVPVVTDVIRRRLRETRDRQEADDIRHDVVLRLVLRLRQARASEDETPIADFDAYAAVTAERACHAYLRQKFPARTRLRNRIRYVLARHDAFRLEQLATGRWLCGRTSWPAPWTATGTARVRAISAAGRPGTPTRGSLDPQRSSLIDQVDTVLAEAGGPTELDDLVSAVATRMGVTDHAATPQGQDEVDGLAWWESVVDPARLVPEVLEQRAILDAVWTEVQTLPVRQRCALLLNLRDSSGRDVISLLPLVGVASFVAIAGCLEMSPGELAVLWPHLPIDDLSLASRLEITRQQVINLRKAARDRLARRLRRWSEQGPTVI